MIQSKNDLKNVLEKEKKLYCGSKKNQIIVMLKRDETYTIWKYVRLLRISEYFYNRHKKLRYLLAVRKLNLLGDKLGFNIGLNTCGAGLKIWHRGSIIIHPSAIVGENVIFHGNNCIGNRGSNDNRVPVIGNGVDIGFGSTLIGPIFIADNCIIGAQSLVNKSFAEEGRIVVGIPAKIISEQE